MAAATALARALRAWRDCLDPDGTELIALTADAVATFEPPAAADDHAFQRVWMRAVASDAGRCWALATVGDRLPGATSDRRATALAKRIEVLLRHAPDPRLPAVFGRVAVRDVEHTPRLITAFKRLADPAIAVPDRTRAPTTARAAALWGAVLADPADDSALAVLADVLQAEGEPRGELIALQMLAGGDDEVARVQRVRQLLATHGKRWLGGLAEVVSTAVFKHGLIYAVAIDDSRRVLWDRVIADRGLATVRRLSLVHRSASSSELYVRFLTSPMMRSLSAITMYDDRTCSALADAPASVTTVWLEVERRLDHALRAIAAVPRIRALTIAMTQVDELLAEPWTARLTALEVRVGARLRAGFALWPRLAPTTTLTLVPAHGGFEHDTDQDFRVTLGRHGSETIASIAGEWMLTSMTALEELPADVTRIALVHRNEALADRIRGIITRPGVEVVLEPPTRRAAMFRP